MKHAYLVMPFNNFNILKKQISLLDYPNNDIYIHMDAKIGEYDNKQFMGITKYSNLYFVPRKKLFWADISQVDIVLGMIEYAKTKSKYDYYHLLSGVDLPIKTQKYIHSRLEGCDKILLAIYPKSIPYCNDRVMYYYSFLKKPYYRKTKILKGINLLSVKIQKLFRVNRIKNYNYKIYNGWDWGSIPNEFSEYLLERKEEILKIFDKTLCPSELVYHTYAYNSEYFRHKIKNIDDFRDSSMRLIDWERGRPYTFRTEDFDEIINSNCFFARKFDEQVDFDIVEMIYNYIKEKQDKELKDELKNDK